MSPKNFTAIGLLLASLIAMHPIASRAATTHIVINEIQTTGATSTDEFVELANPTDTIISIEHWKLQKKTVSGNASNLVTDFGNLTIAPHHALLITHPTGYHGTVSTDLTYSTSSSIANDNTIVLIDQNGNVVDSVGFGSATQAEGQATMNPPANGSISRMRDTNSHDPIDTDSNATDFTVNTVSNPLNATSPSFVPLVETTPLPVSDPVISDPLQDPLPTATPPSETTSPPPSNTPPSANRVAISSRSPIAHDLEINEYLPNPESGDEWVEIVNRTSETLALGGMSVSDGSNHAVSLVGTITGQGMQVVSFSSATLNNSGDQVQLHGADGSLFDVDTYGDWEGGDTHSPAPTKGQSLARQSTTSSFVVTTTPTPGAQNLISTPIVAIQNTPRPSTSTTTTSPPTPVLEMKAPPQAFAPGTIQISEIYPTPNAGEGEWVELFNPSTAVIPLTDWSLADAAGTKTNLSGSLNSNSYLLITNPRGHLNNGGDTVTLFDPANTTIAQVMYPNIPHGSSYAHVDNKWQIITAPTPDTPNTMTLTPPITTENEITASSVAVKISQTTNTKNLAPAPVKKTAKPRTTKSKSATIESVALDDVPNLDQRTRVRTVGTISVPPIGSGKTFYLADSPVAVYLHGFATPTLMSGDIVAITGTVGTLKGTTRITISHANDLRVTGHDVLPNPEPIFVSDIGADQLGWLVTITGTIVDNKGGRLLIDDTSGRIGVTATTTTSDPHLGDTINATGIIVGSTDNFRIIARDANDVSIRTRAPDPAAKKIKFSWISISAAMLFAGIISMIGWRQYADRKKRNEMIELPNAPALL